MASFEELLQCSICLERFTQPKVLPCQHTFCLKCLNDIVGDTKSVNCPTCRRKHNVPKGGVSGFNDNLMALNLLAMSGESADCGDCGKNQILSDCPHCHEQLCTDCRVAHKFLQSEIMALIQSLKCDSLKQSGDLDTKEVARSLQVTLDTEASVHQAFQEAAHILNMRKNEILAQVQAFAKFQNAKVNGGSERSVADELRNELTQCRSIDDMKALKTALGNVGGILNRLDSCLEFNADFSFGELLCDGKLIAFNADGSATERGESTRVGISEKRGNVTTVGKTELERGEELERWDLGIVGPNKANKFPQKIAYASKTAAPKLTIGNPALGVKVEFHPTRAVYSALDDSVYCLTSEQKQQPIVQESTDGPGSSGTAGIGRIVRSLAKQKTQTPEAKIICSNFGLSGILMKYSLISGEWTIFSVRANDINVADSGQLLIAEDKKFVKYEIRGPQHINKREQTLYPTCSKVVQIACHGQEIVVIDSEKGSLMEFTEEGRLVREIKGDSFGEYSLTDRSRLKVDGEGKIYVSCVRVAMVEKVRAANQNFCQQCDYAAAANVKWEVVVFVLTWEGKHVEQIKVGVGSRENVTFDVIQGQTRPCSGYVAPQPAKPAAKQNQNYYCDYNYGYQTSNQVQQTTRVPQHPKTDEESDQIIRKLDITLNSFCIDGDGFLCATSPGKATLDVYNPNRLHVRTIGGETTFRAPWDVSLMPDGRLVVCDPGNARIQVV